MSLLLALLLFQADSLQPSVPKWILSETSPRRGQAVEAWLAVPGPRDTVPYHLSVEFPLARPAAWFREPTEPCGAPPTDARRLWEGSVDGDMFLAACVLPTSRRTTKVIATARIAGSPARRADQLLVVSDPIHARPWIELGPGAMAALTAALGLLTGLLAHVAQQWWDRRRSAAKAREELELLVAKLLAEEWQENLRKLEEYVSGTVSDPPDDLSMRGYNSLLGKRGALSYLRSESRAEYFDEIDRLYRRIVGFHDAVQGQDPSVRQKADELRRALAEGLDKLGP